REEGVLHQLLADLGDAPELVRADDHLAELDVELRILLGLANPLRLADIDLDRDLPLTRHALADVTDPAHDILVLQFLDELADELIRHSVSAGAVRHEAECTRLGARDRLPGHEVPECDAILARTLAIERPLLREDLRSSPAVPCALLLILILFALRSLSVRAGHILRDDLGFE